MGPSRSHKSPLVNCLGGLADRIRDDSLPATVGVRIVEADRPGVASGGAGGGGAAGGASAGLELWDVSGDQSYEATWPAVAKGADAVVLVYDPDNAGAAKEVELWHEWFVVKHDIPFDRVVCFALTAAGSSTTDSTWRRRPA